MPVTAVNSGTGFRRNLGQLSWLSNVRIIAHPRFAHFERQSQFTHSAPYCLGRSFQLGSYGRNGFACPKERSKPCIVLVGPRPSKFRHVHHLDSSQARPRRSSGGLGGLTGPCRLPIGGKITRRDNVHSRTAFPADQRNAEFCAAPDQPPTRNRNPPAGGNSGRKQKDRPKAASP